MAILCEVCGLQPSKILHITDSDRPEMGWRVDVVCSWECLTNWIRIKLGESPFPQGMNALTIKASC